MLFHLTEEQVAIQDALRGTLADVLTSERLHALVDGSDELDWDSWDALMQLGVGGLVVPDSHGGSGLGLLDAALAVEVGGECAATGPLIGQILTTLALAGTDSGWIGKLARGEAMATLAWGGATPDDWSVLLDEERVSGTVRFVQTAATADLFLVGLEGARLGIVVKDASVTISPGNSADRTRRWSDVTFVQTPVTLINADAAQIYDAALVLGAADALGAAQRCLDMSVTYAKEREQFGRPIGQFQALKHQLAQMALEVEPSRALVWYAAHAWDAQLPDARRFAAVASAHLKDCFTKVARDAVAAHGGIGYTWEYDLSVWFRRSLSSRAYLGSPALQRARSAELAGW